MDPASGAIAVISGAVRSSDGNSVQLEYPRSLAEEVVRNTFIPAVEGFVRSLAHTTLAVHRAVVTAYSENELQIAYLRYDAKVIRHDVIPVVATLHAHQWGRDRLDSMDLDADLWASGRAALDEKRRRRLGH